MIRARKECPEFGWGKWRILNVKPQTVLTCTCEWRGGLVLAVHNFAAKTAAAEIPLRGLDAEIVANLLDDDTGRFANQR